MARGGQAERQRRVLAAGWERRDVVYQYGNGWTLEQVVTPADQKRESELMGNCIAEYIHMSDDGLEIMFSLRDPNGRPHVDLVVYRGEVVNIEGRAMTAVKSRYERMVRDFTRAAGIQMHPDVLKRAGEYAGVGNLPGKPGSDVDDLLRLGDQLVASLADELTRVRVSFESQ